MAKPVGELKSIVSLVDRTAFDLHVYPGDATRTLFQPAFKNYHNFTQETVVMPFSGRPDWGQRITFDLPHPWQGDFLNWVALRLKPMSWLSPEAYRRMGQDQNDWVPIDPASSWIWASSLGSIAIDKAEMEVDGVIIETFSGDWSRIASLSACDINAGAAYDDALYGSKPNPTAMDFQASEDGYVYCYLPFWFSKYVNAAFPLLSCSGPHKVRFHVTLKQFSQVVRKLGMPLTCNEVPCGVSFRVREYSFYHNMQKTVVIPSSTPSFESADMLVGLSHIDGPLRDAYLRIPHEIMMETVTETTFNEPLKYVVNSSQGTTIKIQLPLEFNGPIKQLYFFLRRNASIAQYNDWNNYSATLCSELDPTWNPERPLLEHAQLMLGTAIWADEGERWWRVTPSVACPGGIRSAGNYVYGYNFTESPHKFDPAGSVNASRVDMRLNLTVTRPGGTSDGEWTVSVFAVGNNWMRFENGIANLMFMD